MGPVRKLDDTPTVGFTYGGVQGYAPVRSPDAFAYDDDVTPDATRQLREAANKFLSEEEWEVVDGFDGKW